MTAAVALELAAPPFKDALQPFSKRKNVRLAIKIPSVMSTLRDVNEGRHRKRKNTRGEDCWLISPRVSWLGRRGLLGRRYRGATGMTQKKVTFPPRDDPFVHIARRVPQLYIITRRESHKMRTCLGIACLAAKTLRPASTPISSGALQRARTYLSQKRLRPKNTRQADLRDEQPCPMPHASLKFASPKMTGVNEP